jgi:uncharacterized protein YndB with AHSA1/START domain
MVERKNNLSVSDKSLVIERVFDAPRHLVFEAWTKKEHLEKWSAPKGFSIPFSEGDLRPGGRWKCRMLAPDGTEHRVQGVYREIVLNERLVFSHGWEEDDGKIGHETIVTVRFFDEGSKTKIIFEQGEFKSVESRDGHKSGWSQGFDKLGELLTQLKTTTRNASTADREIVTIREFDAPRELVWDAWTNPEKIVKWWGPNGFTNTIQGMDVRPGGTWRHILRGPDGKEYPNHTTYVEVVKPERLSFRHESWPNHFSTATFEDLGGKTRVTLRMVFESAQRLGEVEKNHKAIEGAKQTLGRLAELLAKG